MYSKEEKLSLLSEMIEFASEDRKLKKEEYNFIIAVAKQLSISKDEVNSLIEKGVKHKSLHPESQRILQFHRLVLLMNVDQKATRIEVHKLKKIGLRMGLRSEATDTVLKEMHNYPNKIIPPEILLNIFSKFYN